MIILGIDTAMAACSVAVIDTAVAQPLASAFEPMERGHAEALAPMVDQVMREAGVAYSAIDRVAVTMGPGTFTGVRIGLAMARGLGLALGIPVIGIDTLSAIAANDTSGLPLLVVSDARNAQVYAASFDGNRRLAMAPCVLSAREALDHLPVSGLLLGTAAETALAMSDRTDIQVSPASNLPAAATFARLVAEADAPTAMPPPLYLRAPDAKPQGVPLRRASSLDFQRAETSAAALLSSMHTEAFDTAWSAAEFAALLATPGAAAVIAVEQGEPAGFILTRRAADEAEILTVCTRPFAQRRGVAKALLDHQFTELFRHGVARVFIEVAASNVAARRLYDKAGFATAGLRKLYYNNTDGPRDDAIVMRRELTP